MRDDKIANAIFPQGAMPGIDAQGAHVGSLTEAVMGMTAALTLIGESIARIADVLEDIHNEEQA